MKYEKPEMEVVVFEGSVSMTLSLSDTNKEGDGEGISPYGVF